MSQTIKDVCIKAQAVKDNLQELDGKYNNLFYSDVAETVNVDIKNNTTGAVTTYSIDNFKKIEETTATFTSELYGNQQFKALVNGVFIVEEHMDRPFFIDDVAFVDNSKMVDANALKINDSLYEDSVLILKSN